MKISRKLKRIFNFYNLAILICIILILVSAYILLKPEKQYTPSGIEVATTKIAETEEITEEEAVKLAIEQFKKIGEKNIDKSKLEVLKILKNKEEYYYISSPQNTVEIKIKGGKVTMINSATVKE